MIDPALTIVVLPGLDGTGYLHGACTGLLSVDYRLKLVTYPPSVRSYADALAYVTDNLPDSRYIIVAESFSGPVAITLAAQNPPHLRGIVCVASFASSPRFIPREFLPFIHLWPMQWRLTAWLAQPLVLGRWASKPLRHALRQGIKDTGKSTLIARLKSVQNVAVRDDLAQLSVPCLYLQATHDRLVPNRAARPFQSKGLVKRINGPHFLMQANPSDCAQAIIDYCRAL